jgi:hypothetical protein
MEQNTQVLKWSLIIGIVIVLNLFFNYALSVIYKAPDFNEVCKAALEVQPITTSQACLNVGGKWNAEVTPENRDFNCNATFTCQQTYEAQREVYERNAFITRVALGVAILIASFFMLGNLVIAYGLALGGVLSFLIASVSYWSSANDIIKLIILALALAALIFLAAKKYATPKRTTHNDYDREV